MNSCTGFIQIIKICLLIASFCTSGSNRNGSSTSGSSASGGASGEGSSASGSGARGDKSHRQLIDCIRGKDTDALLSAVSSGAVDVNFTDDVGQTLLNWASAFGTREMVEFLCEKGAISFTCFNNKKIQNKPKAPKAENRF